MCDRLSLGKIVQIPSTARASRGKRVTARVGDPIFAPPPTPRRARQAEEHGHTHYTPKRDPGAARRPRTLERQNGITLPDDDAIFVTNGAMTRSSAFAACSSRER